ncbi:MAG: ABC transporter permease [Ignavibacteriales bacterium]|nr:ABC transporter permease [Ignavibacteriales bacterium]
MFLLPTVCLLFVSAIYKNGSARELPVAVIDHDNSYISRMIIRSLDATGAIKIVDQTNGGGDVQEYFLRKAVYGVFEIPEGFEADVKHGNRAVVAFYKSSFNLIISNSLLSDANNAVRSISGGILIQKMQSKGFSYQQALVAAKPVRVNITTLYNPWYNYEVFLVYSLYLAILQVILAIGGVFLGNQFRKRLLTEGHAPFNTLHLMFIAFIGSSAVITGNLIISSLISRYLFGVIMPGNSLYAWLLIFLFMYFLFTAGNVAGMLLEHREMAVQVIIFFLTPAFILSGYTYPIWGMPRLVQVLAEISPFTHFLRGYVTVAYMDEPRNAMYQTGILLLLLAVALLLQALVLYRKRRSV